VPRSACFDAAFETCCQIGRIDRAQGCDDLLLRGIRHFHFQLGGHAAYLCGGEF
jgi:hypothetical protein